MAYGRVARAATVGAALAEGAGDDPDALQRQGSDGVVDGRWLGAGRRGEAAVFYFVG